MRLLVVALYWVLIPFIYKEFLFVFVLPYTDITSTGRQTNVFKHVKAKKILIETLFIY